MYLCKPGVSLSKILFSLCTEAITMLTQTTLLTNCKQWKRYSRFHLFMPVSIWLRTVGKCVGFNSAQLHGDGSPTRAFWLASSASCPLLAGASPPEPPLTEQLAWTFQPSLPKEVSQQPLPPAQPLTELWDAFWDSLLQDSGLQKGDLPGPGRWVPLPMCCTYVAQCISTLSPP